jgi:hypothetical protein
MASEEVIFFRKALFNPPIVDISLLQLKYVQVGRRSGGCADLNFLPPNIFPMSLFNKLVIFALFLALVLPQPALWADWLPTPLIALSVLCAILATGHKPSISIPELKKGVIWSYLLFSIPLVIIAQFVPSPFREGILLYALFPPAVSTIVMCAQWGGKPGDMAGFHILSYALSIVFIPVASQFLIGSSVSAAALLKYLALVYALPCALPFFVQIKDESRKALLARISEIALALVFYIMMANSMPQVMSDPAGIAGSAIIFLVGSFLITYFAFRMTKDANSTLYSMMKNGAASATAALAVLGPGAVAIISVRALADVFYIVFFSRMFRKQEPAAVK